MLHLTPSQYGFYFGIISVGYMLGNFVAGRYSRQIGLNRMMLYGNVIMCIGLLVSWLLFSTGVWHPLSLFGPASFIGIGNGMTLPNANAGIVSVKPHLAGSASGLGGALTMIGAAGLAALAASVLNVDTGPYPMIEIMLGSALAATLSSLLVMHRSRPAEAS
jgi:DHA1 family bicyclomycin/chloramphenicol resistance-like MFS transporter